MSTIETLAVIPARLKSTRLPEKPLLKLCGRELVLRVLDGVKKSERIDRVVVATDDEKIASVVRNAGGEAIMTPADLPTGSDRVAWVARQIPSRFVINVQGDDPMVTSEATDPLIETLKKGCGVKLVVLAKRIGDPRDVVRDSVVKMVFDQNHRALYFSRSPIPYPRNAGSVYYKHIGPYAWERETLLTFASWPQTPLERSESLEMLRLLENGYVIKCVETETDSIEIDTPEDVEAFERLMKFRQDRIELKG